ncbi:hypothetical protein SLEP1_g22642 [Rubroshorea leprosula]|uniref:Uncharacterized protein n=1 Tax=Rubroshorea leprosula TaxID=152421 RepID=A0AAV5J9T8_9ROSI|nr:hypothetical protein SLEP1_g22642 [Rubroshorea leprosula]
MLTDMIGPFCNPTNGVKHWYYYCARQWEVYKRWP